ncbi:MAG: hypothetical protein CL927_20445 [Deltaproteobacteria bacterium]|mgnify:CR=1 FL=1|nr:hypothetical protein [Deltaproteobacteria bacterium]HCH64711.1 hypothetical protein [Deltaproteobacteria bacterium]
MTDKRQPRTAALFALLGAALVAVSAASVLLGAMSIPFSSLLQLVGETLGVMPEGEVPSGHRYVLVHLRLPRTIFAVLIGGALSVSGAMMQGLFRNPLADPGLLGVSSGAALGAAMVIVLGFALPVYPLLTLPLAAFIGGVLATIVVMRLSFQGGRSNVASMLLAGIAINAVCGAGTGLLVYISDDEQLRSLTFWTMGSVGGASWDNLPYVALLAFGPVLLALPLAKSINAMLLGESEAHLLGVNVERLKRVIIFYVCVMVGTSVSLTGMIGFVGLVVPHLCRLLFGADNRRVFTGSLLLGAIILLSADLISRTVVAPAELPIGIVTSIVGGPFFLSLLYRSRRGGMF